MRNKLKAFENIQYTYIAEFSRYGSAIISNRKYDTVLLKNIKNVFGDYVCEHIWVREPWKFKKIKLQEGDKIMFKAVVKKYKRGYFKDTSNVDFDYCLKYFHDIKKI